MGVGWLGVGCCDGIKKRKYCGGREIMGNEKEGNDRACRTCIHVVTNGRAKKEKRRWRRGDGEGEMEKGRWKRGDEGEMEKGR